MGICSGISMKFLFVQCFQIQLEFRSVDFCGGWKTGDSGKKSWEQGQNQQQTQPICNAEAGNRTWATLVGGEHSPLRHPCIPKEMRQNEHAKRACQ